MAESRYRQAFASYFLTAPQFCFGDRQRSEKPFGDGLLVFFGVFNTGILVNSFTRYVSQAENY